MVEIDKHAQLRICELEELLEEMISLSEESEEYICDLQKENYSLRMFLSRMHDDRGYTESPRFVWQPRLH